MAIWEKVKEGIDKAGKAAQDAFDEGKTRIDAYRARESADKAAEAVGYAYFRAVESGGQLEGDLRDRLMRALREKDTEARRLEAELTAGSKAGPDAPPPPPPPAGSGASDTSPPPGGAAPGASANPGS